MKRMLLVVLAVMGVASVFAAEGAFPRVWTSTGGCRTAEEFEQMAEEAERDEELDEANREQWAKLAALKAEMEKN